MATLTDREIRNLCVIAGAPPLKNPLIEPFSDGESKPGEISYGLTSAGYDLRIGGEVWVFKNTSGEAIDPKRMRDPDYIARMFDKLQVLAGQTVTIPSHGYVLATSYEYIRMPRHMRGDCVGKSTYARCGVIVNTTPLEPGWEGKLTIEISNSAPCPVLLYVMEGVCQLIIETLNGEPEKTYADKNAGKPGIYQAQSGVTPARVRE